MADEAQYLSGNDSNSNKRKYEDQAPPVSTRRPTGFSAPIIVSSSPDAPPPSYNSVPHPMDDIQLAKQKAQEIAARIFNNASAGGGGGYDTKRPRTENGGGGFDSSDKGFSSAPSDVKPMISNSASSAIPVSYGYQATSKRIDIPNGRVGVIIGKAGETIKYLQIQSGAKIQVTRDMDADPGSQTRMVELMGNPEQIAKAEQLISEVLSEAESGGSGVVSRRVPGQYGTEQFVMKIPNNKVGLVIGKGGETIKNMQARTGARIQVIPLHPPPGDTSTERTLQIDGTSDQIESAKVLVNEVISENRARNPSMGGGYPQQGYQARPPMQQPGYGYVQPGSYSGPSPQYNTSQQQYAGYSQPTSGGYSSNWDQSSTVQPTQQPNQVGYDYYSQQAPSQQQTPGGPPAPAADNAGSYNYSQMPASSYNQQGQGGYSQDGYGGYSQSGYGSYDQQQGYNSATGGYGNVANTTQDGHSSGYGTQGDTTQAPPSAQSASMGQQGYSTGQQPSPSAASYPSQGSTQPGYGMPPTSGYGNQPSAQSGYPNYGPPQVQKPPSNPPAYGQTQQSPGNYGQAASGYPHSQQPPSGYSQPDSGTQRQPGYGAPPYSAAAGGYGQMPPPYSSYSQPPPAYSADGSASGNARGTYDAAPAAPSLPQGGVAKASPQS